MINYCEIEYRDQSKIPLTEILNVDLILTYPTSNVLTSEREIYPKHCKQTMNHMFCLGHELNANKLFALSGTPFSYLVRYSYVNVSVRIRSISLLFSVSLTV